jgi:hypothetical protein
MDDLLRFPPGPQRIGCLTEEATGWLRRLGREHRMGGMQGSFEAVQDASAARVEERVRQSKVFFEKWDTLHIGAIRWVSERTGITARNDCLLDLAVPPPGKRLQPKILAGREMDADLPGAVAR